jgi:hypothetical protein
MENCEKASRVSSYEFSDTEGMTCVRPLGFHDGGILGDFLAEMAMLQEAISGRHIFEVRNNYSNE